MTVPTRPEERNTLRGFKQTQAREYARAALTGILAGYGMKVRPTQLKDLATDAWAIALAMLREEHDMISRGEL